MAQDRARDQPARGLSRRLAARDRGPRTGYRIDDPEHSRGGRGADVFTALGVATGQAAWTLATCTGLAALLLASEPAFLALKLVGAGYLVFLGAQALLGALSSAFGRSGAVAIAVPSRRRIDRRVALRQGVVSNLGNPKMAVFFTSLLPQFAPGSGTSFSALLLLGLVFFSLTLAWLAAYAMAVAKAGDYLRPSGIRRAIQGLTGAFSSHSGSASQPSAENL